MERPSSSSSSSFVPNSYEHDVFISFRGEDTRKNFTSHLYAALCRNNILTYIDEKSLERGEKISPSLLTAIEKSQLSLVVFSKDYASSTWCLDELVHILKCNKERGQIIIPIFYQVDLSDIRHQKGSYGAAFVAHQKSFKHDRKKVLVWKSALKEAAGLSGFDLKDESESEFIEKIVKDVLEKLEKISTSTAAKDLQSLVGMSKRLEKIESLLCVGSSKVLVIGIWGMGGIGKTTLAGAVYKKLSTQFDSCFFINVKEEASEQGLNSLREKLFCTLLKRDSVNMGRSYKDDQLRRKKVLVVLDNVDGLQQLENLLQKHDVASDFCRWCGVGSAIIITSRDRKLLERIANEIYDVDALDSIEARELFYAEAFKRDSAISDYEDLVKRVLDYAKGHPLAIKVLGSYLHCRSREEWESTLSKLKKGTEKKIQNVLQTSYDALDDIEKAIFLDIACFFKGEDRDFVEGILGEESHIAISVLIERSLITINNCKRLSMHDLMQEMGWEIIRQESRNEPANRSRLWIAQDVLHVLKKNKGTETIEGIFLDMSKIHEDIWLEPAVFEAMSSSLRLLKIYAHDSYGWMYSKFKVYLRQDLRCLPNSLRYLCWDMYPSKALPSNFTAESLVELRMRGSQLTQLWDGVLHLENLKRIDLGFSEKLVKIPDLSHATRLESIHLDYCTSLVELPPLNFQIFDGRKFTVQKNFRHRACGSLCLAVCHGLQILPEITGNIGFLNLSRTPIKELPSSIRSCEMLLELDLRSCENLENFPELPGYIEDLDLSGTSIREMPATSIECLQRIKKIVIDDCKRFESLPSNFCKLKSLKELSLRGCSNFKNFPEILEPMEFLERVILSGTEIQELPSSFEKIIGLRWLYVADCRNLETIPECTLRGFRRQSHLYFRGCSKLKIFPEILLGVASLRYLNMGYCNILEIPHWIGSLSELSKLDLKGNVFASIPSSIKQLSKLQKLDIRDCRNLQSLPELPFSLEELLADGCLSIETVSTSSWMPSIFMLRGCSKLKLSACNNIAVNFLCGIFKARKRSKIDFWRYEKIQVFYWGNRIPKWIGYQSEGSTLSIKLPPNWHNSNFFGFVTCTVLSIHDLCFDVIWSELDICCELQLKDKCGGCHCSTSRWCLFKNDPIEREFLRSDHVFMCHRFDAEYFDAVEMSFRFFCEKRYSYGKCPFRYEVKRIGVHMLYSEKELVKEYKLGIKQYVECMVKAAEMGIDIHQYIRSDLQAASHNVAALEAPPEDDNRNTAVSWDSTTIHEDAVDLNYFTSSSDDSDNDHSDNTFEDDSDAMDNEPKPSATPILNFDAEESWFEIIKCFVFSSCSRFLDCILGNREN